MVDRRNSSSLSPDPHEVVQVLSRDFAKVYEFDSLSLWESRALRPGEGECGSPKSSTYGNAEITLSGRYRVRPSRVGLVVPHKCCGKKNYKSGPNAFHAVDMLEQALLSFSFCIMVPILVRGRLSSNSVPRA